MDSNGLLSSRLSATQDALGQIATSGQSFAKTLSKAPTAGVTAPAPLSSARSRAADVMASSDIECSAWVAIASARLGRTWPPVSSAMPAA